jgi:hypothetical protein
MVDVKISGWAATICNSPRITVPLLLTTTDTGVVPAPKPVGTTKSISEGELPTKYKPAAAPPTETETPFNSTGSAGLRVVSEPVVGPVFDGARSAVEVNLLNSPGASPTAVPGVELGVALGLGLGLGVGLALGFGLGTAKLLGQVKSESPAGDSVITGGNSSKNASNPPSWFPPPNSRPLTLNAIRLRLLLARGRSPNDAPNTSLVSLVMVFEEVTGICVAKICVAWFGFKPSLAVVGNVPSAL